MGGDWGVVVSFFIGNLVGEVLNNLRLLCKENQISNI